MASRRPSGSQRRPRPSGSRRALAGLLLLTAPVWVLALRQLLPDLLGAVEYAPDVLLAALAAAAWEQRPLAAVAFAAASGCLLDAPSALPWGVSAARYSFLVALFASLRGHVALDVPGGRLLMAGVFALSERLLAAATWAALVPGTTLEPLLLRGCWIALATLPLAPLAFAITAGLRREAAGEAL